MNPVVLVGIALVGYYLYSQYSGGSSPTAATGSSTSAAAVPPMTDTAANPGTPPGAPVAATPPNYTGPAPATYAAVVTAALQGLGPNGGNTLQSPDVWNFYLRQAVPSFTPPTPEQLFPGASDPHAVVSFNDWWQAMRQYLPSGLSGWGDLADAAYSIPDNPVASAMARGWYV